MPNTVLFKSRPVVGGHFSLLSMYRAGLLADLDASSEDGSVFAENSTQAVSAEIILPTQASVDLGPSGSGKATEIAYSVSTATTMVNGTTLVTTTISSITETGSVSSVGISATSAA